MGLKRKSSTKSRKNDLKTNLLLYPAATKQYRGSKNSG
jgi:hypothetical protein